MKRVRRRVKRACVAAVCAAVAVSLNPSKAVEASGPEYRSKYAGQEERDIKSLSEEDIEELKAGGGWGLAKAAELNGVPGPKHILEMKREIELSREQEEMVRALYRDMNKAAVELGGRLIEYERDLNRRFAEGRIDEKVLAELLARIAETYSSLRYTHLSAHLKTPGILTEEQIRKYNRLRGYSADDPCENIPEGHDPAMWRRHHDCD